MFSHTSHLHIVIGLYSVTGPLYVSEMSPSNIRGKLGLASYLHTGGGILIGSIAVGLFSIDSKQAYTIGWRLVYYMLHNFMCTALVKLITHFYNHKSQMYNSGLLYKC